MVLDNSNLGTIQGFYVDATKLGITYVPLRNANNVVNNNRINTECF